MRDSMMRVLTNIARKDKDLVLLTADLGYGVFEGFEKKFKNQYFNVGVAEQNMVGIACGLALSGKKVFIYSIGNFPTLRCLEQIRNSIAYHNLSVFIISMGGGFSYGSLGFSHHATEDLSIMNAIPNLSVYAPSTTKEAFKVFNIAYKEAKPAYIRLDKSAFPSLNPITTSKNFSLYFKGKSILIIGSGGILEEAFSAKEELIEDFDIGIASFYKLKPLNKKKLLELFKEYQLVISLEENNVNGGIYSILAKIINESDLLINLISLSINDKFNYVVGSQKYLRKINNIDKNSIKKIIRKWSRT